MGKDQLTPVLRKAGTEGAAAGGKISTAMRAAGQAMALFGTIGVAGLTACVKAAQNLNLASLQTSVKNAGIAWGDFKPKVDAAGAAMGKLGFTQGETNLALSRLITVTHNGGQSLNALNVIADLARFRHISLAEATDLYTRAVSGNTRGLRMLGISASQLPPNFAKLTEAQRYNIVTTLMQNKVHGQAAAYAQTFSGKLAVLRAQGTNLAASIGVAVIPMLSRLIGWFSAVIGPIMQNKAAFAALSIGVMGFAVAVRVAMALVVKNVRAALISTVIGVVFVALSIALEQLFLHWRGFCTGITTAVRAVANFMRGPFVGAFNAVKNWILGNFIRPVVNAFMGFAGAIVHAAATAFGWVPGIGGKLRAASAEFDRFRNNVNRALGGVNDKKVTLSVSTMLAGPGGTGASRQYAARGGPIYGPGTATSDSIPAQLSNGEYVITASAHQRYGTAFFDALNAKRLAGGGAAGDKFSLATRFPSMASINAGVTKLVGAIARSVASMVKRITAVFGGGSASPYLGGSGSNFQNLIAIARYFVGIGYSKAAAAGIAGNVYRESAGNPEARGSGGEGLIGWTPPRGYVTGNRARDLAVQIPAIQRYNLGIGRAMIAALNRISDPGLAALFYMNAFEKPYGSSQSNLFFGGVSTAAGNIRAAMARRVYQSFDKGGLLHPGFTLAYNGTGVAERVISPLGSGGGGNTYNVTVNVNRALASREEIGREVSDALTYFENHGGRVPYTSNKKNH